MTERPQRRPASVAKKMPTGELVRERLVALDFASVDWPLQEHGRQPLTPQLCYGANAKEKCDTGLVRQRDAFMAF